MKNYFKITSKQCHGVYDLGNDDMPVLKWYSIETFSYTKS